MTGRQMSVRWPAMIVVLLAAIGLAGCGEAPTARFDAAAGPAGAPPPAPRMAAPEAAINLDSQPPPAAGSAAPGDDKATPPPPVTAERKIIYTAHLSIVVQNLDQAIEEVTRLVEGHKGYVAKSEVTGQLGQRRQAVFTLRVPVGGFRPFREGLLQLGIVERNTLDTRDVTEEYVDIEARIRNLKEEEQALNKLLRESATRAEVLQTRQEIVRVRTEIDRLQGRLNLLNNLTALSTIHLTLREEQDYKPPVTPAVPTFPERVEQTFFRSWQSFVEFSQGVVLLATALTPWLLLIVPVGLVSVWLMRRAIRHSRSRRMPVLEIVEEREGAAPPPLPASPPRPEGNAPA